MRYDLQCTWVTIKLHSCLVCHRRQNRYITRITMWRHMTALLPSINIVKRKKKDAALFRAEAFRRLLAGTPTSCSDEHGLHVT